MQSNSQHKSLPIGVFDSGMGGLTVLKELTTLLPNESFIYLGDTARLPYGTKSIETVKAYAEQMVAILLKEKIKLLVIACNTATTAALNYLQEQFPEMPMVGVIQPGASAACQQTQNKNIAVIATEATIKSAIYQNTLHLLDPEINVIAFPCGLFVALAEEGCVNDEIATVAVAKYLQPILDSELACDCVLLGCTHFPVLKKTIIEFLGPNISIVDSAKATAITVKEKLQQLDLFQNKIKSNTRFLVTDLPERFVRVGEIFLGKPILQNLVNLVDTLHLGHGVSS